MPRRIVYVAPKYPQAARRAKLSGTVALALIIGPDGAVKDVRVLEGIHPLLDESAVEAVKQWRFTPVLYSGTPGWTGLVMVAVTVEFKLH